MKILSIDWDYFFPDSSPYDWGHNESMFYLEAIWPMRLASVNMWTGQEAFSEYVPTIPRNFWKRVVKNKPEIYFAESHASIAGMPMGNAIITNLDAHHDCGYKANPNLDCGNWAWYMGKKIKEYHLCYPEWRKPETEGASIRKPTSIIKGLPEAANYDAVFVCRSGCWTPPWFDLKFKSWLKQSGFELVPVDEFAVKSRSPNMAHATKARTELVQINQLLKGGISGYSSQNQEVLQVSL